MKAARDESGLPAWTAQAKQLLDASTQDLDAATLSRLNRARQAAVARRKPRRERTWLMPAGLAGACVLLLAVALAPRLHWVTNGASGKAPVALAGSDADIVAGDDSLELYQDLEFYAWLDAQSQDGGS